MEFDKKVFCKSTETAKEKAPAGNPAGAF